MPRATYPFPETPWLIICKAALLSGWVHNKFMGIPSHFICHYCQLSNVTTQALFYLENLVVFRFRLRFLDATIGHLQGGVVEWVSSQHLSGGTPLLFQSASKTICLLCIILVPIPIMIRTRIIWICCIKTLKVLTIWIIITILWLSCSFLGMWSQLDLNQLLHLAIPATNVVYQLLFQQALI